MNCTLVLMARTRNLLVGEDVNRNGVLDKNEKDLSAATAKLDPGLFEKCHGLHARTECSHADGSSLTNVNTATQAQLQTLFQDQGTMRRRCCEAGGHQHARMCRNADRDDAQCQLRGRTRACVQIRRCACRNAGMSSSDFATIYNSITTSTNTSISRNRVNVNTANADVLTALFMGANLDESTAESAADTLISYRQENPQALNSISWVIDALGTTSPALTASWQAVIILTVHSYQFTRDYCGGVGVYGRGYRRVKFVFDVSKRGAGRILYRQGI